MTYEYDKIEIPDEFLKMSIEELREEKEKILDFFRKELKENSLTSVR